jgi:hypothetical protein
MKLEGYTNAEIGGCLDVVERTIERRFVFTTSDSRDDVSAAA